MLLCESILEMTHGVNDVLKGAMGLKSFQVFYCLGSALNWMGVTDGLLCDP